MQKTYFDEADYTKQNYKITVKVRKYDIIYVIT